MALALVSASMNIFYHNMKGKDMKIAAGLMAALYYFIINRNIFQPISWNTL